MTTDTLFDALIRAGKRPAIVARPTCTVGILFRERDMDYYLVDTDYEMNAKVCELIMEDKHDVIVVHPCDFDSVMHKYGPESIEALSELKVISSSYAAIDKLIREHWSSHNVLCGIAMDHGCHTTKEGTGTHGTDMPEDLNITHLYKAYKKNPEENSK